MGTGHVRVSVYGCACLCVRVCYDECVGGEVDQAVTDSVRSCNSDDMMHCETGLNRFSLTLRDQRPFASGMATGKGTTDNFPLVLMSISQSAGHILTV